MLSSFSRLLCGVKLGAIVWTGRPVSKILKQHGLYRGISYFGSMNVVLFELNGLGCGGEVWKESERGTDFCIQSLLPCRGTDSVRISPVMSLTDVAVSLFLIQAAMAVVQLFTLRGPAQVWALRVPSPVFTLHPVSMAGYRLKQPAADDFQD